MVFITAGIRKAPYYKDNTRRAQARIYLQSNRYLLQQLHCEASKWIVQTRNQHPTLQILSIRRCQSFPVFFIMSEISCLSMRRSHTDLVLSLFLSKGFEALFVLKHIITMNFVTDHFPNDHVSCSETSHLSLNCTNTATTCTW